MATGGRDAEAFAKTLGRNGNKSGDAEGDVGRQSDHHHCVMAQLGLCADAGWLAGLGP